jgi:hypothetical protein
LRSELWRLNRARLDAVEDSIIPISVKARDLSLRIEPQEVSMGYEYDLALLRNAGRIGWNGPAHHGLDHDSVFCGKHFDHFDSEVGDSLRKGAPDGVKAAPNRDHTVSAIGRVSPDRIISAKREHALDIVSVIGGEELAGDACEVYRGRFHRMTSCGWIGVFFSR